jgi:hypothetical protein
MASPDFRATAPKWRNRAAQPDLGPSEGRVYWVETRPPLHTCYMRRFRLAIRLAFVSAGLLGASLLPTHADPPGLAMDPLHFVSDCLGRVSALRVHHDAYGDREAEARAEAMRVVLVDLVGAIMPPDGGPRVLAWRAEARAAQATLLTQAALNADAQAAALADRLIAQCGSMIVLPGAEPA